MRRLETPSSLAQLETGANDGRTDVHSVSNAMQTV